MKFYLLPLATALALTSAAQEVHGMIDGGALQQLQSLERCGDVDGDSIGDLLVVAGFEPGMTNVRAMDIEAFDSATDPHVDVYVGVPEAGIYVLSFKRSGPTGGPYSWGFDASQEQFIETPGDVHDLKVRPATLSGVPRTLLVSDGPAGFRMYGEQ